MTFQCSFKVIVLKQLSIIKIGDRMKKHDLIKRMELIGQTMSNNIDVLAVLALGSIGVEHERLDAYSDLDFYIITEDSMKHVLIDDLAWLHACYPLAFSYKNTKDGYKFFFEDGIYGEFAIFGRSEVPSVIQNEARLVYRRPDYHEPTLLIKKPSVTHDYSNPEDEINEAMTNLYVGITRALRGERLSAQRFIEHYAVDHVLKAYRMIRPQEEKWVDPFNHDRRIELNHPTLKPLLSHMIQGYDHLSSSALAILNFAHDIIPIHPWLFEHLTSWINQLRMIEENV